jgi:hypothetical protein
MLFLYISIIYIIYVSVYCFLVHKIFMYLCVLVYSASSHIEKSLVYSLIFELFFTKFA